MSGNKSLPATRPFSVRLTPDQRVQLQVLAKVEERTPSEVVRRLIRAAYERLSPPSAPVRDE